jgi:hypothetical protein
VGWAGHGSHRTGDLDDTPIEPSTLMRALIPDREHLVISFEKKNGYTVHGNAERLAINQIVQQPDVNPVGHDRLLRVWVGARSILILVLAKRIIARQ